MPALIYAEESDMNYDKINFREYMNGRAALYSFMAGMFSESLTYEKIETLNMIVRNFAEAVTDESVKNELTDSITFIEAWLREKSSARNDIDINLDLAREHAFYFALGKFNIPDTASSVLSKNHLIKREEWENCKKFYTENGYVLKKKSGKIEDSFEVQCRFMETLIRKTAAEEDDEAIAGLLEKQIEFLEEHVLVWIEVFGKNMKEKALEESIYRALAIIPFILIKIDNESIYEVAADLKSRSSAI